MISILNGEKIPLHGGGVSERCFIHIEDVAAATYRIMQEGTNGEIYHIANDRMISIRVHEQSHRQ